MSVFSKSLVAALLLGLPIAASSQPINKDAGCPPGTHRAESESVNTQLSTRKAESEGVNTQLTTRKAESEGVNTQLTTRKAEAEAPNQTAGLGPCK